MFNSATYNSQPYNTFTLILNALVIVYVGRPLILNADSKVLALSNDASSEVIIDNSSQIVVL